MTKMTDIHGRALARRSFLREARVAVLGLVALFLSACSTSNIGGLFKDSPAEQQARPTAPDIAGGGTRVALLLPLSLGGEMTNLARGLKQAAELALLDNPKGGIVLVTRDTGGTAGGAKAAAEAAIAEGAQLIIGPLLAEEVSAVSPVARAAGVNVIAFSSSASVAGNGTYLMNFAPEDQVAKVVQYAAANGYETISALLPGDRFGQAVESALQTSAGRNGVRIGATERYDANGAAGSAARIAPKLKAAGGGQALMIPQGGQALGALGKALQGNGIAPGAVKVLGTGQWDDSATASVAIAQGGWYAGVPPELTRRFEQKYAANYGAKPPRVASLAYDAVSLAIGLKRSGGLKGGAITNAGGFQGQNGLFRFRQSGVIDRGLAILEMTGNGPRVVSPAPTRFAGS